ncbi:transforming growth factor-beta-induced protein ig-h3 [Episyrphus balteatus]|uniref:transforming growth factor-beta-induced protein ig-h3 n=1 Tax=Episyrphus balteatus TaxID=286459 RepID=UPI0024862EA7|nr:transforming growth factor-beta-induced protein ig-h3 [Episyrphus balteatus]
MGQLFFGVTIAVMIFAGGYASSIPYFDLEDEIEHFGSLARTEGTLDTADALAEAVISGDNSPPGNNAFFPAIFPSYNNPFFSHPMFSPFGNINFGIDEATTVPWWRGKNVCVDRVENEDDTEDDDDEKATTDEFKPQQIFGGFQFSVNSCVEKPHKHTCKKIYSTNGKKKTLTVTRQCCQGFGRRPNAEYTEHCEKMEMKSFEDAATDMGGNEFMRSVKNNGLEGMLTSNVTLFLPTNEAFTTFSEQMFENNLVYVPMGSRHRRAADDVGFTSKDLLLGHMVNGLNIMEDLANEDLLMTKLNNSTIRINIFNRPFSKSGSLYTANCAPLTKINQPVTNGVIHSVKGVLSPVTSNVMDIIRKRSDMAVFKTVLEKTRLNELLEGERPVTVFAPTDAAFEKLDISLRKKLKEGKVCATNILKSHILDFTYCSQVTSPSNPKPMAYNILGESLRFELSPNEKSETEMQPEDLLINGLVRVVERDIMGTNGVIHVVDTILPSDSSLSISSLMQVQNISIFKSLLEASGLESEFNDYDNATIFAPIDKSFEDSEWVKKLEQNPEQLKNSAELKEFLRGHVVKPKIKTCDLKEDIIKTEAGSDLRINLYSTHSIFTNVMNRATVNCARLVHFDDESCGSVLHQVEKQLESPKNNLYKIMESNPQYSKFLEAVKIANLTELLMDDSGSYTVFMPNNEVFREFDINVASNKSVAERFVKEHVVNDIVCCTGITPTNWPFVRTIEALSGSNLRINRDRRPKVENAMIMKCDVLATNGIIHEINDVILSKQVQAPVPVNKNKYNILRDVFF